MCILHTNYEDNQEGQNDLLDDVVYNTALLNEVNKIEKEAIKRKISKLVNIVINFEFICRLKLL